MNLKTLFRSKIFYLSLLILIIGIVSTSLTSDYIIKNFNPPVLSDLILDSIISLKIAWVYDILAVLVTILLATYIFTSRLKETPYFLVLFGFLYFLRAIFIILTPLGNPGANNDPLFTGPTFLAGLYFSGHTAEAFLAFLLAKGKPKIIFLVLLFSIIFLLLIARGHYSIDILSGLIFAYAIYMFGEKHLKQNLIIQENESKT